MNNPTDIPPSPQHAPVMSAQEASWHETMAGHRATAAAKEQGANPSAIDAILATSQGGVKLGPVTLKPATKGTAMVLQKMGEAFEEYATLNHITGQDREDIEEGIATIVFMDSLAAWQRFNQVGIVPFIEDAQRLMWEVGIETAVAINKHIWQQMALLKRLTDDNNGGDMPGKPQLRTGDGPSPETATQSPATTPHSSNGSWPSTPSHSTMPSGHSPLPPPASSCPPATSDTVARQDPATAPTPASTPATGQGNG